MFLEWKSPLYTFSEKARLINEQNSHLLFKRLFHLPFCLFPFAHPLKASALIFSFHEILSYPLFLVLSKKFLSIPVVFVGAVKSIFFKPFMHLFIISRYHIYCVGLKKVPSGTYICIECKPEETPESSEDIKKEKIEVKTEESNE